MYRIIEIEGKPHLLKQGHVSLGARMVKKRYVEKDNLYIAPSSWGKTHRHHGMDGAVTYCSFVIGGQGDWIEKDKIWSDLGIIEKENLGGYLVGSIIPMERMIKITKGVIKLSKVDPYAVKKLILCQ